MATMEFTLARDLDDALAARAHDPGAELLAGGTDLMVEVNLAGRRPGHVIGLRRVAELKEWSPRLIGAGVTWAMLENADQRALAQAARTVGSPQIRNAGTIGGNIGTASPAGDGLPWIAAADADIVVRSRDRGARQIPWHEFFVGVKRTTLEPDEVIVGVAVPDDVPRRQHFAKVGVRNAMVISTVAACVMVDDDGNVKAAFGSVAPTPIRVPRAEAAVSPLRTADPAALDEFARIVSEDVRPITDHRSTEAYRRHAAGVLARRLLARCLEERS